MTRFVTVAWAVALVIAWVIFPNAAQAQNRAGPARTHLKESPCPGCLASFPDGTDPVPLIVALHGDYESAVPVHDAWERHAAARGVAVLALACPSRLGCKGSYWQWNGDPSWIDEQITKLAERRPIDRERLWLTGWSGGASYAGYRTQELEQTFAAIVIHGGGMAPQEPVCSDTKSSVYFLAGDKNPLHALAVQLRRHYEQCGNEVVWDLVPGAEHPAEWKALTTHGGTVLDWLATKRRVKTVVATNDNAKQAPLPVSTAAPPPHEDARPTPAPPALSSKPPRACGCTMIAGNDTAMSGGLTAFALALLAWRRRVRSERAPLFAAAVLCACSRPAPSPPPSSMAPSATPAAVTSAPPSASAASSALAKAPADSEPPPPLRCIVRYYVGSAVREGADWSLLLPDGTKLPYDDRRAKTPAVMLESPDLEDTFAIPYTRGAIQPILVEDHDPGRVRSEPLLRASYGATEQEVSSALVPFTMRGHSLRVHRKVVEPFRRVAKRIDEAVLTDPSLDRFFRNFGGTFNWRPIAGTDRKSAHGWGIAIDIDTSLAHYWRNDTGRITWKNRIPQPIVDAFEAEGFVWGGRWFHYDTMHFEYRPELLDPACTALR